MGFCKECRKAPPSLPEGHALCRTCWAVKPAAEFLASSRHRRGIVRRCLACHRAKNATSIERHRDARNQRNRAWTAANLAYFREYASENAEKKRTARARWQRNNPEAVRAGAERHRALKAGADGSYTAAEWAELCKRYGRRCLACRAEGPLTVDHVVPLSRGGSNYIANLQPLCQPCNTRKRDRTIDYRPQGNETEP